MGPSIIPRASTRLRPVAVVLMTVAIVYVAALALFDLGGVPGETFFGAPAGVADAVHIYLQPVSVDPLNDSIRFEVGLGDGYGLPDRSVALPDRELTVTVAHRAEVARLDVHIDQPAPASTVSIDLEDGSVADYPFERFHADMHVICSEAGTARPVRLTLWGGLLGWRVEAAEAGAGAGGGMALHMTVRRAGGIAFFGFSAYCAMALVALCGLTISALVFAGVRRIEATLVSALGAMVFALPAIRNALPGAPPLGVRADLLVYLWAEAASVASLALFVIAWARRGPVA